MIRLADTPALGDDLRAVLDGTDYLHGCLLSTHRSTLAPQEALFWVLYGEAGRPLGALLRYQNEFILCDGGLPPFGPAAEELAQFLRFMGCTCLCARWPLLEALCGPLGLPPPQGAPAMVLPAPPAGPPPCPPGLRFAPVRGEEALRQTYRLIVENYDQMEPFVHQGGYPQWLSALRRRQRDGVCDTFALFCGVGPVCTGAYTAASGRFVDIGAVVTHREWRGQGLGAFLVLRLAALAAKQGRGAVLGCAREGLEGYYARLGFRTYDRWGVCEAGRGSTNEIAGGAQAARCAQNH